jgi:hypothetical protein
VAWPNPQFNGHINTFFFNSLIFCKDNKSQLTTVNGQQTFLNSEL